MLYGGIGKKDRSESDMMLVYLSVAWTSSLSFPLDSSHHWA